MSRLKPRRDSAFKVDFTQVHTLTSNKQPLFLCLYEQGTGVKQKMAMKYGELERYLGQKYATDLANAGGVYFQEATELVDNSLKAMEMYNKHNLFITNRQVAAAR